MDSFNILFTLVKFKGKKRIENNSKLINVFNPLPKKRIRKNEIKNHDSFFYPSTLFAKNLKGRITINNILTSSLAVSMIFNLVHCMG